MSTPKRVLSGIRPTGDLHLGNYVGAVRKFLQMQESPEFETFYFVADLHALTTAISKTDVKAGTIHMVRQYLACGLDPNKAVIYRQSDIPEIPYISTLLSMVAPYGRLQNCTTFKDKSQSQKEKGGLTSAGLLTYPVLMAADILSVRADYVPVGEDQLQHLEMCREFASSMNNKFGTSLPSPVNYEFEGQEAVRLPGLDGSGKMGKSSGGKPINLISEPDSIRKQIKKAKTDQGPVLGEPMSEPMRNIFAFMKHFSSAEVVASFEERYNAGEQGFYGELKNQIADDVIAMCAPIREAYYNSDSCSEEAALDVMSSSAAKVRPIAESVQDEMLSHMGITS